MKQLKKVSYLKYFGKCLVLFLSLSMGLSLIFSQTSKFSAWLSSLWSDQMEMKKNERSIASTVDKLGSSVLKSNPWGEKHPVVYKKKDLTANLKKLLERVEVDIAPAFQLAKSGELNLDAMGIYRYEDNGFQEIIATMLEAKILLAVLSHGISLEESIIARERDADTQGHFPSKKLQKGIHKGVVRGDFIKKRMLANPSQIRERYSEQAKSFIESFEKYYDLYTNIHFLYYALFQKSSFASTYDWSRLRYLNPVITKTAFRFLSMEQKIKSVYAKHLNEDSHALFYDTSDDRINQFKKIFHELPVGVIHPMSQSRVKSRVDKMMNHFTKSEHVLALVEISKTAEELFTIEASLSGNPSDEASYLNYIHLLKTREELVNTWSSQRIYELAVPPTVILENRRCGDGNLIFKNHDKIGRSIFHNRYYQELIDRDDYQNVYLPAIVDAVTDNEIMENFIFDRPEPYLDLTYFMYNHHIAPPSIAKFIKLSFPNYVEDDENTLEAIVLGGEVQRNSIFNHMVMAEYESYMSFISGPELGTLILPGDIDAGLKVTTTEELSKRVASVMFDWRVNGLIEHGAKYVFLLVDLKGNEHVIQQYKNYLWQIYFLPIREQWINQVSNKIQSVFAKKLGTKHKDKFETRLAKFNVTSSLFQMGRAQYVVDYFSSKEGAKARSEDIDIPLTAQLKVYNPLGLVDAISSLVFRPELGGYGEGYETGIGTVLVLEPERSALLKNYLEEVTEGFDSAAKARFPYNHGALMRGDLPVEGLEKLLWEQVVSKARKYARDYPYSFAELTQFKNKVFTQAIKNQSSGVSSGHAQLNDMVVEALVNPINPLKVGKDTLQEMMASLGLADIGQVSIQYQPHSLAMQRTDVIILYEIFELMGITDEHLLGRDEIVKRGAFPGFKRNKVQKVIAKYTHEQGIDNDPLFGIREDMRDENSTIARTLAKQQVGAGQITSQFMRNLFDRAGRAARKMIPRAHEFKERCAFSVKSANEKTLEGVQLFRKSDQLRKRVVETAPDKAQRKHLEKLDKAVFKKQDKGQYYITQWIEPAAGIFIVIIIVFFVLKSGGLALPGSATIYAILTDNIFNLIIGGIFAVMTLMRINYFLYDQPVSLDSMYSFINASKFYDPDIDIYDRIELSFDDLDNQSKEDNFIYWSYVLSTPFDFFWGYYSVKQFSRLTGKSLVRYANKFGYNMQGGISAVKMRSRSYDYHVSRVGQIRGTLTWLQDVSKSQLSRLPIYQVGTAGSLQRAPSLGLYRAVERAASSAKITDYPLMVKGIDRESAVLHEFLKQYNKTLDVLIFRVMSKDKPIKKTLNQMIKMVEDLKKSVPGSKNVDEIFAQILKDGKEIEIPLSQWDEIANLQSLFKKSKSRKTPQLTAEEMDAIESIYKNLLGLISILYETGAKSSRTINAAWKNIHQVDDLIKIRKSNYELMEVLSIPKEKRAAYIEKNKIESLSLRGVEVPEGGLGLAPESFANSADELYMSYIYFHEQRGTIDLLHGVIAREPIKRMLMETFGYRPDLFSKVRHYVVEGRRIQGAIQLIDPSSARANKDVSGFLGTQGAASGNGFRDFKFTPDSPLLSEPPFALPPP